MLPQSVRDYLESHRDEHLAALLELLRIPSIASVHDEPDSCLRGAGWLAERLRGLGAEASVDEVEGGRPNVVGEIHVNDAAPTVLLYGHYDVQPPEPLELWTSGPFEPEVRDGRIYARGANDDKGQLFTHLMAVEAWQRAGGGLPVNVKFLLEGEEEIGSPHLEPWLATNVDRLAADAVLVSDSEFFAPGCPSITYALRGLAYFQIRLRAQSSDVHSGIHGGALVNPANALARMIAAMHDSDGRVTIPGYYDDVRPLTDDERRMWSGLPFDGAAYARSLGLEPEALVGGEKGYSILERRWARPTLDCNGVASGYAGPGSKTIIPAEAVAKISMRLVPDQDPAKVEAGFRRFIEEHTPPGLVCEVETHATARPALLATDSPAMRAARAAAEEAFGRDVVLIRCGASVPITDLFQRLLGLDAVLMGFGLPDDNVHAPNEKFDLEQLWGGSIAAACFLGVIGQELGAGQGENTAGR